MPSSNSARSSPSGRREGGFQPARDRGVAEVADPLRLGEAGDRDDAGEDRHLDAARPRRGDEVEVDLVVEEELGDQEGGARVDLRLQVGEVGVEVGGLGVDLGEAGAADREVPARGDELGQLGGAAQAALGLDEVLFAPRRVAAQGEDVLDPGRGDPVERLREALPGLADAAQVRHRLEADLVLERLGDLDRALAGGAAGAVGDRGEVELQVGAAMRAVAKSCSVASPVFGGKNSTEKVGSGEAMISSMRIRAG